MRACLAALAILCSLISVAAAEVKSATPDAMLMEFRGTIPLPREQAWARALAIPAWWSDGHTWSADASNMTLDARAGGCWCESWADGQVEHGRVLALMNGSLLRLQASLGPLQEMAVSGVLLISLARSDTEGATDVMMTYRVNGVASSGLDALAPVVDGVMAEQFARLIAP